MSQSNNKTGTFLPPRIF